MAQTNTGLRPGTRTSVALAAAVLLALPFTTSCVTQKRYDDVLETSKLYQRSYHDMERYQTELEAEIEALRAQLALGGTAIAADASYSDELDSRLSELEAMEARVAGIAGDGAIDLVTFDGGYGYRLDDSVLFATGSASISAGGQHVLSQLAKEIQARPFERIWVRGHTDDVPIVKPDTKARFPRGNLELSSARAMEVAGLLIAGGGVDPDQIVVVGFGPTEPAAPNDSAEGKQKNRRVEIYVDEE